MTLSVVTPHAIYSLEHRAEALASNLYFDDAPGWSCAFHHAIDLIAYARGIRTTTRCVSSYEPNEIERRVERALAERGIYRGMRERR